GHDRGPDRPDVRHLGQFAAASALRQREGPRGHLEDTPRGRPRYSDDGGSRPARIRAFELARLVGPEGHATRRDPEAQQGGEERARRCERAQAAWRTRTGAVSARPAYA